MRRRSVGIALACVLIAAGVLSGCGDSPPVERTGGETNWLRACQANSDCDGTPCTCGVCAATCSADRACPDTSHEACAEPESNAWRGLCGEAEASGVCLPSCTTSADCAPGYACRGGGCAPEATVAGANLPAFPGAEGFAARVPGGRGGRVVKVTTLEPEGPGSLQAALDLDEPRIVVFEVSGVIAADLVALPYGNVTIAGQSAPGGGITLRGRIQADYDADLSSVVIRHLRLRPAYDGSDPAQFDVLQLGSIDELMLDHVSAAFAVDEAIDIWSSTDVTVQWCTIETPNVDAAPSEPYAQGVIAGTEEERVSLSHTLIGHQPGAATGIPSGPAEVVGSVFYDVRSGFTHGEPARGPFALVDNTFRSGPNATLLPYVFDDQNAVAAEDLGYHLEGNVLDGDNAECPSGPIDDPWTLCAYDPLREASLRTSEPPDFTAYSANHVPVTERGASESYAAVLERAGAFPRDVVTRELIEDVRDRGGVVGGTPPEDLEAGLTATEPLADGDDDGIPDEWETAHGLDPSNPEDRNAVLESGYPAVEQYLNELAEALLPP